MLNNTCTSLTAVHSIYYGTLQDTFVMILYYMQWLCSEFKNQKQKY